MTLRSNCPNCGAPGVLFASDPDHNLYRCEYCGSTFAWAKPPEERAAEVRVWLVHGDGRPVEILRRPPRIPTKETR